MRGNTNNHGGEGDPNPSAVDAYPSAMGSWISRRFWILIVSFFLMFMLRNMVTTDYTKETREYLRKAGKEEVAEYIAPKTLTELRQEKLMKDMQFDQMLKNVTRMSVEQEELKTTIALLSASIEQLKQQQQQQSLQATQTATKSPKKSSSSPSSSSSVLSDSNISSLAKKSSSSVTAEEQLTAKSENSREKREKRQTRDENINSSSSSSSSDSKRSYRADKAATTV